MLKLRNPGWPPEGTSGSPVSVFMPGHIAPKEERQQREQKMKGSKRSGSSSKLKETSSKDVGFVWKQGSKANRSHSAKAQ